MWGPAYGKETHYLRVYMANLRRKLERPGERPRFIRTDKYDYVEGAHHLYSRVGMTPVRYMEELLRPLMLRVAEKIFRLQKQLRRRWMRADRHMQRSLRRAQKPRFLISAAQR